MLGHVLESWVSLYANHAALRTGIEFIHIGGLVAGVGQRILAGVSKHLIGRFFVALRKEFEQPIGGAAG